MSLIMPNGKPGPAADAAPAPAPVIQKVKPAAPAPPPVQQGQSFSVGAQGATTPTPQSAAPAGPAPSATNGPLPYQMSPLSLGQQQPVGPSPYAGQRQALISSILSNPHTMGQTFQDQLAESQKDQALAMRQQLGGQVQQDSVSRGRSSGSGVERAILGGLDNNLVSQLLGGRRQIAVDAATQNRQDELGALSASNAADAADLQRFGYNNDVIGNNNQSAIAEANLGLQGRQLTLQELLGKSGIDLEQAKFGEGKRQFNTGAGLDLLRFIESQRQFNTGLTEEQRQFNSSLGNNQYQFNATLGNNRDQFGRTLANNQNQFNNTQAFNWAGLNQNQNTSFLDYITRYFG